jgi:hypothetical protein
MELSTEVIQHTALLVQLTSLPVDGLERLLPEPNRLFPALDGASRKHQPPCVVQDLDTPTDRRSVRREAHFASLIHDLQAPCLEHVRNGWHGPRRQADPENHREP